ncbi:MAG: tRNA-dihydrouridine synthase family protein [Bacilli bacterium]|jgi:tRNA-dihydrouridine synthase B
MKEFSIAGITLGNRYIQAPLAGFTDYSMRKMASDKGASLVYSEMESSEALVYNSKATIKDVQDTILDKKTEPNTKLALQIFGGKEEVVLKSIPLFEKYGQYDFLDFNCGCPVPKVLRQHAGSYWLNRPDELIHLLKEMVKISSKPVILKIRIGFSSIMDMVPLAKRIEETGVQAIAIHGRTKAEGFSGPVHYEVIKDIKDHLTIPVIANGDITEKNFTDILKLTGADALMIGQRAIGYPKVFEDMIRIEQGLKPLDTTLSKQVTDLKEHLNLIFSSKDEKQAADIMKGISVRYLKGFDNMRALRMDLVHSNSLTDYLKVLSNVHGEQ